MRKYIPHVLIISFVFLLTPTVSFADAEANRIFKLNSKAVVMVTAYDEKGNEIGRGSGFIVRRDGAVVTNYHVIGMASDIKVKAGNKVLDVEGLIFTDKKNDLAILKAKAKNMPVVKLGVIGKANIGEHVYVIGYPLGLENTMIQGRWVNSKLPLLLLADKNRTLIETYIPEEHLERISVGGHGRFLLENPDESPVDATIVEIDSTNTTVLNEPLLASIYGGDVPVTLSPDGILKIHETMYKVILKPDKNGAVLKLITRGTLKLVAERESILKRTWNLVTSVIIRESSF